MCDSGGHAERYNNLLMAELHSRVAIKPLLKSVGRLDPLLNRLPRQSRSSGPDQHPAQSIKNPQQFPVQYDAMSLAKPQQHSGQRLGFRGRHYFAPFPPCNADAPPLIIQTQVS